MSVQVFARKSQKERSGEGTVELNLSSRSTADLMVLLQHHFDIYRSIAEELARRTPEDPLAGLLGQETGTRSQPDYRREEPRQETQETGTRPQPDYRREEPRQETRARNSLDQVLDRSDPPIQQAAEAVIEQVTKLPGVSDPIPERPRDNKGPRYFRFAVRGQTFAYVNTRRDHLRVDLHLQHEEAEGLRGEVRYRKVQPRNPLQVSVYLRGPEHVDDVVQAIRRSYEVGRAAA